MYYWFEENNARDHTYLVVHCSTTGYKLGNHQILKTFGYGKYSDDTLEQAVEKAKNYILERKKLQIGELFGPY